MRGRQVSRLSVLPGRTGSPGETESGGEESSRSPDIGLVCGMKPAPFIGDSRAWFWG